MYDQIEINTRMIQAQGLAPTITARTPKETIGAVVAEIERRISLIRTEQLAETRKSVIAALGARAAALITVAAFFNAAKYEPREYPKVLAMEQFPNPGNATQPFEVVLRDMGAGGSRYVTHCHSLQDNGYYWGHYFDDELKAREDFTERSAKYRVNSIYFQNKTPDTTA